MDFGDTTNNMFCLNGNPTATNNINNASGFANWYSSWQPPHSTSSSSTHLNINADGASALHHHQQPLLYAGSGSQAHPDPHLTCLKLGKRHYFEDANNTSNFPPLGDRHVSGGELEAHDKRAKGYYGEKAYAVARCQVEGCQVALVNAKEYHRRHKVCEMHSKAAKVVVLGREQRFCQQCSRFHVVSEFDDSKRSCRRRLAGHNERRRKSSHHSVAATNSTIQGCALSLLSPGSGSWLSQADLSIRCSAALHELIAENRASLVTRQQQQQQQLVLDRDHWNLHHHDAVEEQEQQDSNCFQQQHMFPQTQ